jgi:pimeloyl-ACP methyl ester carboxylesterase
MKDVPLLLIHGYPFDHTMWFSTIATLGTSARVIVPDLPGFGRNPVAAHHSPSLEYYADLLAGELAAIPHEKVVVAGMSMGGYVALAFAEKFPERLCGLGLISSQAGADTPEIKHGRKESISKIRANGVSGVAETLIPKMFAEKSNPDLHRYAIEGAAKAGIDGLTWALEAMARRPDRTAFVKSLSCPVLVLHGSEDRIVPFAKARELAEACQKPIFVEVHGAGHATPLEAPDQVAGGLIRLMGTCRATLPKNAEHTEAAR